MFVCLFVCAQALLTLARWLTAERNVPTFNAHMHATTQAHPHPGALQVDVYVEAAVYDELAEHSQSDLVKVLKARRPGVFPGSLNYGTRTGLRPTPWRLLSFRPVRR